MLFTYDLYKFGHDNDSVLQIHIGKIPRTIQNAREVLANILTASQNYMRGLKVSNVLFSPTC